MCMEIFSTIMVCQDLFVSHESMRKITNEARNAFSSAYESDFLTAAHIVDQFRQAATANSTTAFCSMHGIAERCA